MILILTLFLGCLYLPGLGSYGLYDPWETHYGEVARNMVETGNYIDPYWGSPWDTKSVKRERAGFYSKPPLTMWLMSLGMNIFGYNELGVRFFFPILMIMALMAVYLALAWLYSRLIGLLGVLVMGTSPFVVFMSRQAVTDGPLVAIMTIGMMALGVALADSRTQRAPSLGLKGTIMGVFLTLSLAQLWVILPLDKSPDIIRPYQGTGGLFFELQWWVKSVFDVGRGKGWFLAGLMFPAVCWTALLIWRQTTIRILLLCIFYMCCGLVVTAKGWLGWAPMGLSILGFLIITNEWRTLKDVNIGLGLLIVFLVGHPWVIAMLCGHHPNWWNRFIVHDHYKRLFAGVHDLDDGAFEYFFQWLGIGMLPWIALLPAAFARQVGRLTGKRRWSTQARFELLITLWAVLGFFMFSKSSTKFHHYIFPIVPSISILIALVLYRMIRAKRRLWLWSGLLALSLLIWVGQDVVRMPNTYQKTSTPFTKSFGQLSTQNFVNLFTYKYERQWPVYASDATIERLTSDRKKGSKNTTVAKSERERETDTSKAERLLRDRDRLTRLSSPVRLALALAGLGLICLSLLGLFGAGFSISAKRTLRGALRWGGGTGLLSAGLVMSIYCLHVYLPEVSEDWSQKKMWDAYYADCTERRFNSEAERTRHFLETASRVPTRRDLFPRKVCAEPIIAFRTNWRGEAFYSANTILPALEKEYLTTFLETYGKSRPFYVFTEKSRIKSELESTLPKELKGKYTEIFGANVQFVLLKFSGVTDTKPNSPSKEN